MIRVQQRQRCCAPRSVWRRNFLWLGAAWLGLLAADAIAATCSAASPGLSFGNYNVFSAAVVNMNGTVSITCSRVVGETSVTVSYEIFLATGQSNSFVQRKMNSGANLLGYNLYTTNAHSIVWGDGTGSTRTVTGSLNLSNANPTRTVSKTVFGQIPALQDVAVGIYGDNVHVTVNY